MIGRSYTARIAEFTNALAAGRILCRISAPATAIVLVERVWLSQVSNSNLNELNAVRLVRLSTDGAGGAAITPEKIVSGDTAFAGTMVGHDADGWTAEPTVSNTLDEISFNLAAGFEWAPTNEDFLVIPPSGRFGLQLARAPAASYAWSGGLRIREIG